MNIAQLFARIGISADTKQIIEARKGISNLKDVLIHADKQAKSLSKSFKENLLKGKASIDDSDLKKFNDGVKNVKNGLIGIGALVTGVSFSIKTIFSDAMNSSIALKQFSAETGASTDVLQKWQAVAQQTNTSVDAITESVKALAENREKIKLGQGNISGFQLLGINPNQDPFEILEELKQKTEGLPQAMKKNVLAQLGVSSQLIQVLELSNAEFTKMKSNAFIIPQNTIQTLTKAKAEMDNLGSALKWIGSLISEKLSPIITKYSILIKEWIKQNKEGLITGIQKLFALLVQFVTFIANLSMMINDVVTHTIGWDKAIIGVAAAFALFNKQLIMSPIGLFTLALFALFLVLEDLYVFSKGGKSIFGDFAKNNPAFKKMLDETIGFLKDIGRVIETLFKGDFSEMDKVLKKWGVFGILIQFVRDVMLDFIEAMKLAFKGNDADFINFMKKWGVFGDILSSTLNTLGAVGQIIMSVLGGNFSAIDSILKQYDTNIKKINFLGGSQAGAVVQQWADNSVNNNSFTIQSNQDPKMIAKEVQERLERMNREKAAQNDVNSWGRVK